MVAILLAVVAFATVVGYFSGAWKVVLPVVALLLVLAWQFGSLTTVIDGDTLRCFFGPGLIRRQISLRDIEGAEPVRNRWWYGWGVRLTPHGWMYNVSGLSAVQLSLRSGRRFRIGTDRPDELARAIREGVALGGGSIPEAP